MKYINFAKAIVLASVFSFSFANKAMAITDQMAFEAGMTPLDEVIDMFATDSVNIERAEYVTSFPSQEDIQNAIKTYKQVIVVDKSIKGQTLRMYRNSEIVKIKELTKNEESGKKELREKDFVSVSTGTEAIKHSPTRSYVATTPMGFFRPTKVYKMYYSGTWKADMPNAVFFRGGVAIHATSESHYPELGHRASGGCVRTRLEVSEQVRKFVMDSGKGSEAGQYSILAESYHRDRITKNSMRVDNVSRNTGLPNDIIDSWDTVIVVYENK